jgi:acetyl esterase/lipase
MDMTLLLRGSRGPSWNARILAGATTGRPQRSSAMTAPANAPPATPDPATLSEILRRIEAAELGGSPETLRSRFLRLPDPAPEARRIEVGGVPCLTPASAPPKGPTLIWLHGGGYVFGAPETHLACADALATRVGARALTPRYRLAPEHRWPAMLDDALSVLDATAGPVVLAGDSAGGHLALSAALARPGRVSALALFSPNADRTIAGGSRARNADRDAMNDPETDAELARLAFDADPATHPDGSPARRDLSALPPLFVAASTHEVLLDDALALIRAASAADAPCALHVEAGMPHMWTLWPTLPEAARAYDAAAAFLRERIGKSRSDPS